jgi:hypothetical protein
MAGDPTDNPPLDRPKPNGDGTDAPAAPRGGGGAAARTIHYATPNAGWREYLATEWRWVADSFSAEAVLSFLKTLAWVAPLTLLIWIYAEREQVTPRDNNILPFKIVSPDPNKTAVNVKAGQSSPLIVDLEGPRARVESVLQQLRGGEFPEGLEITIDRNLPPKEHTLPTLSLLADLSIFRDNGITVRRVVPAQLDVVVEELVDREARVMAPPSVSNLEPSTTFDPPTVRIRGPVTTIRKAEEAAEKAGRPLAVYARLQGNEALKTPGTRDVTGVPLELPTELADPDRPAYLVDRKEVNASLHVRAADDEWTMPSMTVRIDAPMGFHETYTLGNTRPSVLNVKLIGPKSTIEQMKRPDFKPQPYAQLAVSSEDAAVGAPKSRKLRYVDLPPGVRVADPDREFEFEVTRKAAP